MNNKQSGIGLFEKLSPEERDRIRNACLDEFARAGYDQASTNRMVENAGIPKGTLFFYFGSKRDLFLYLVDDCVQRYIQFLDKETGQLPSDLFERLLYIGRIKIKFSLAEPRIYQMFFQAFMHSPPELMEPLVERTRQYAAASSQLMQSNIDRSHFRKDVSSQEIMALVSYIQDGILRKYLTFIKQHSPEEALAMMDQITQEFEQYIRLIKYGVYQSPEPDQ